MKRSIPTGAWIAGGLVAAAMLAPGIAYATATITQLVGTNGTTVAQVSKEGSCTWHRPTLPRR